LPSSCTALATSAISTLSLHDALPICGRAHLSATVCPRARPRRTAKPTPLQYPGRICAARRRRAEAGTERRRAVHTVWPGPLVHRSEEHTSELQSLRHLVCRLLLEKKK